MFAGKSLWTLRPSHTRLIRGRWSSQYSRSPQIHLPFQQLCRTSPIVGMLSDTVYEMNALKVRRKGPLRLRSRSGFWRWSQADRAVRPTSFAMHRRRYAPAPISGDELHELELNSAGSHSESPERGHARAHTAPAPASNAGPATATPIGSGVLFVAAYDDGSLRGGAGRRLDRRVRHRLYPAPWLRARLVSLGGPHFDESGVARIGRRLQVEQRRPRPCSM